MQCHSCGKAMADNRKQCEHCGFVMLLRAESNNEMPWYAKLAASYVIGKWF